MNLNLNLQPFVRRTDESGKIYFIPAEQADAYDALVKLITDTMPYETVWYDYLAKFESEYSKYRLNGSDHGIVMWINPEELC